MNRARNALLERLRRARAWTDRLFALLTPEGLFERPVAERHRFIFYLGHLDAFDWNLVCRDALGLRSRNASFEQLFGFGIDPLGGALPTDTPRDWPQAELVTTWTRELRADVDEALMTAPCTGWLEGHWAFHLALEHRLMHAETLSYLLRRLALRFKVGGPLPGVTSGPAGKETWVPAGRATLGLARAESPFLGWDNEYERHTVEVPGFSLSTLPVSNAQWLEFIDAGGYLARSLWTDDDWAWREREGLTAPSFWTRRDGQWWWRALFGDVQLPADWPVYVSHAEASAYARWKGQRLPTEAEWHLASATLSPSTWTAGVEGNFGGLRFEPVASGTSPAGHTAQGVADLVGNGWEWTSTVFAPFDGFAPLPFYPGYSANFFDGKHFVLKGASASTDVAFLRTSFRNWFQPHYPHVFAKFRLAGERGAP